MKIPLRHILLVFLALLAISFIGSMRSTMAQTASNRQLLTQVEAEHDRLLLEQEELERQLNLASSPFVREQTLREANLVKREGEANLELVNLDPQPRALPEAGGEAGDYRQAWAELLFPLNHTN